MKMFFFLVIFIIKIKAKKFSDENPINKSRYDNRDPNAVSSDSRFDFAVLVRIKALNKN